VPSTTFQNGHQTWVNYSEGFDLPDPAKYYGKAGLSVKDNPLAGIKSRQVETGWRFADVDWDAQAAIYYIWSDKVITTDAATLTIDVTDKKSRDFGFEGALTRHFNNGWDAGGTLHLVRSEEEDAQGDWMKRDARYASLSKSTALWAGTVTGAMCACRVTMPLRLKTIPTTRSAVTPRST
jgi:iron complex outermembrane recepter protein